MGPSYFRPGYKPDAISRLFVIIPNQYVTLMIIQYPRTNSKVIGITQRVQKNVMNTLLAEFLIFPDKFVRPMGRTFYYNFPFLY